MNGRIAGITMRGQFLSILMLTIRLMTSAVVVPVALVAGMLTFPTTCQCHADQPHPHALFGLAGHHHSDQRTPPPETNREIVRAGLDGVTVQAATGTATQALTALHASMTVLSLMPTATVPPAAILIPDGLHAVPDVPPPRI